MRASRRRRLIVTADDFGRSTSINQAVIRAHAEGILTSASLMVNGDASTEAVRLAKQYPGLGVGLHLTLVHGRSTLDPSRLPQLVNQRGEFRSGPVGAGWRYFARPGLRQQIEAEIEAQMRKFHATGLALDHLDGHLNLHLHPVVFDILVQHAAEWSLKWMRLTRDPFCLSARLARGQWLYRISHAFIFHALSLRAGPRLRACGIQHTDRVFGLLQNGRVNEAFVSALIPRLPPGDSELYSHPSLDESRPEFEALVDARVKAWVQKCGVTLIRYSDL